MADAAKAPIANTTTTGSVEPPSPADRPTATAANVIRVAGFTAVRATKLK
jgi:hypothetical protein